jgi:hypothetical protein
MLGVECHTHGAWKGSAVSGFDPRIQYYPIRNTAALNVWRTLEDPTEYEWRTVCWWVADLFYTPWQWPSIPIETMSNRPNSEVRYATIPDTNSVDVWYIQDYIDPGTELLYVGTWLPYWD